METSIRHSLIMTLGTDQGINRNITVPSPRAGLAPPDIYAAAALLAGADPFQEGRIAGVEGAVIVTEVFETLISPTAPEEPDYQG